MASSGFFYTSCPELSETAEDVTTTTTTTAPVKCPKQRIDVVVDMPLEDDMGYPKQTFKLEDLQEPPYSEMDNWQKVCTGSLAAAIQMKHEAYLMRHPEVKALSEMFMCKVAQKRPLQQRTILEMAGKFFTRPYDELDAEIRQYLKLPPTGPYYRGKRYTLSDERLRDLVLETKASAAPEPAELPPPSNPPAYRSRSSLFSTFDTSDTTLPTPEPVPPPEPTTEDMFYTMVSDTVDRAIYMKVDDHTLLCDTAYVEVMKVAEEAMEITVIEVRQDIISMLIQAYRNYEANILEKELIRYRNFLETRMRRTMKKTLRVISNFKGYSPPSSTSEVIEDKKYKDMKMPPPGFDIEGEFAEAKKKMPCTYNRYSKDRFGVPRDLDGNDNVCNTTTTPPLSPTPSQIDLTEDEEELLHF